MATEPRNAALYYPHTQIDSIGLVKTALLLWDRVECIVPSGFSGTGAYNDGDLAAAAELIVQQREPTAAEKTAVHQRVEHFLEKGVPAWIHNRLERADERFYLIYPEKLLPDTWRLLEQFEVATQVAKGGRDYRVPPALGLLLMSMLADECAGTTRLKVTDRSEAYGWLMGAVATDLGGEYVTDLDAGQLASTFDRLVTIRIRTIRPDQIPLDRLVELRRREIGGSTGDLRALRLRYAAATSGFVTRMAAPGLSPSDLAELERQYELAMEQDLLDLKRELRLATTKTLLSKEVGTAVIAAAGSLLAPGPLGWGSMALGTGALLKTVTDYAEARRKALHSHAMSWLYVA